MKTKKYILAIALFACLISCEEDLINNIETTEKASEATPISDSYVYSIEEDGILFF